MNASLGIFRAWERLNNPVYQYLGVPICRGNIQEFPKLVDVTSPFIRGLTWYLSKPSRRRTGFPSWSWVGWAGPVEWTTGPSGPAFLADCINLRAKLGNEEWMEGDKHVIFNPAPKAVDPAVYAERQGAHS